MPIPQRAFECAPNPERPHRKNRARSEGGKVFVTGHSHIDTGVALDCSRDDSQVQPHIQHGVPDDGSLS